MNISPFQSNGKYGYKEGYAIVIPPQYEAAGYFHEGYAVVVLNNKFGIIDVKGNFIVDNKYDDLCHLFSNYYVARINEGNNWYCGVINTEGNVIIDFSFKSIQSESDRYFLCYKEAVEIKENIKYLSIHGRYSYKDQIGCNWYNLDGKFITSLTVDFHSKDYVIVKNEEGKFGLLKSDGTILINPKYPNLQYCIDNIFLVTSESSEMPKDLIIKDSDKIVLESTKNIQYEDGFFKVEHTGKEIEWYSIEGKHVYTGEATPLNSNYLRICKNDRYGILDQNGHRIINFLYDEIVYVTSFFAVRRGDKLGFIGQTGEVIVDAVYKTIESVCIDNNPIYIGNEDSLKRWAGFDTYKYAGYCKKYCFDTEGHLDYRGNKYDSLVREVVSIDDKSNYNKSNRIKKVGKCLNDSMAVSNYKKSIIKVSGEFDLNATLILDDGDSQELFTLSDGIINNSRFDKIEQITPICFVVRVNDKYGVFRLDERAVIIPIKYDRILFFGGHTVLLHQKGLWGANSLILQKNLLYAALKVDIPVENREICILDELQYLFCVKRSYRNFHNEDIEYYTIVDNHGVEVDNLKKLHLEEPLKRYDKHHYLTKSNGKFGFVSEIGYVSIPFIFDEIIPMKTGNFNVRIGDAWGVIDINGRELVRVKYDRPMPIYIAAPKNTFFAYDDLKDQEDPFRNSEKHNGKYIVRDAYSGYCGCINNAGTEIIPTVYEHLMFEKSDTLTEANETIFFFGYGGYENEYSCTFFSDIEGATWGCMDQNGMIIIDPKYDCFKVGDHFILAGRDGSFLSDEDGNDYTRSDKYSGVYDLYSLNGELIIGGFREVIYDEKNKILALFFGGQWDRYCSYEDDWNNIHHYSYTFKYGNDLWLIIDENLNTIQRNEDGNPYSFNKGFIGKVETKNEDKKKKHIYNMPIRLMAKGFSHFGDNCAFIKENNDEESKIAALDYKTGISTPFYDSIKQLNDTLFFIAEDRKVGIRTLTEVVLQLDYYLFTIPINGYFFAAKIYDNDHSTVELFHINNLENPICISINKIETSALINDIGFGRLKMIFDGGNELRHMKIARKELFSKDFLDMIHPEESHYFSKKWEDHYFFSTEYGIGYDYKDDNDSYDDHDYMRDSWDAMTDGMYGDMPEGFDGDFGFLGR
ncbi:MAG: WG repeat-containing protein [Muribaculaceae bacterium]|nr:WG repeat-containing protein [Muribaculaceae bacterium]